jgi:hypothetical protein
VQEYYRPAVIDSNCPCATTGNVSNVKSPWSVPVGHYVARRPTAEPTESSSWLMNVKAIHLKYIGANYLRGLLCVR